MPAEPSSKSPLDQFLDVAVFGPVGLALAARDAFPDLAIKGRERVTTTVAMARMIGQFAVAQGRVEAEKAASRLAEQALDRIGGLFGGAAGTDAGSVPEGARASGGPAVPGGGPAVPGGGPAVPGGGPAVLGGAPAAVPTVVSAAPAAAGRQAGGSHANGSARPVGAVPSSDGLAIPGYDTLSASQVVQRLGGLSRPELDAVRSYEAATRNRRTILSKVAQLETDHTASG